MTARSQVILIPFGGDWAAVRAGFDVVPIEFVEEPLSGRFQNRSGIGERGRFNRGACSGRLVVRVGMIPLVEGQPKLAGTAHLNRRAAAVLEGFYGDQRLGDVHSPTHGVDRGKEYRDPKDGDGQGRSAV